MKLYLYEVNQEGETPYNVFAETKPLTPEYCAKDEDGMWIKFFGIAESDNDLYRLLDENGYDGEYINLFWRELCSKYGLIKW